MPSGALPAARASRSARQRSRLTMTGPSRRVAVLPATLPAASASARSVQPSSTGIPRASSSGIELLLEGFHPDPPDGVEEAFAVLPAVEIDRDQLFDAARY